MSNFLCIINDTTILPTLLKDKRAILLFWVLLDKKGSSNLREQRKLLRKRIKSITG